ncbi:hypothetical protein XELAEV_18004380mg [Xenopus laevis]|uniref:Uncharacterized protein n=1 Tax=Xenopus laevis TaxID=8355 RepID=A0A974BRL8_XENLA|nr:hypothetical protein XELAEV_18004380mg [Xenopus laevis]
MHADIHFILDIYIYDTALTYYIHCNKRVGTRTKTKLSDHAHWHFSTATGGDLLGGVGLLICHNLQNLN